MMKNPNEMRSWMQRKVSKSILPYFVMKVKWREAVPGSTRYHIGALVFCKSSRRDNISIRRKSQLPGTRHYTQGSGAGTSHHPLTSSVEPQEQPSTSTGRNGRTTTTATNAHTTKLRVSLEETRSRWPELWKSWKTMWGHRVKGTSRPWP